MNESFREAEIILEMAFLAQTRDTKVIFGATTGSHETDYLSATPKNVLTNSDLTFRAIAEGV